MKLKADSLKKNKIDKSLSRHVNKKRGLKSIKSEMKKKLQWTWQKYKGSWDYYTQPYANKMDNLGEMDKYWERYSFLRLNQKEKENMNRLITSTDIETMI